MDVRIIRSNRRTVAIEVKNGEVLLRVPLRFPEERARELLSQKKAWIEKALTKNRERMNMKAGAVPFSKEELSELRSLSLRDLTERVHYYAPVAGVTFGKISVRFQHTRWGSCSAKGNLSFNGLLCLAPEFVRNYIVIHELCHRKQMNHSKRFYCEVERIMPDYARAETWLKTRGMELLLQIPKQPRSKENNIG